MKTLNLKVNITYDETKLERESVERFMLRHLREIKNIPFTEFINEIHLFSETKRCGCCIDRESGRKVVLI